MELIVVMWLGDKLCLNRIEAGNFCSELNRELYHITDQDITKVDFIRISIALNKKIFGRPETGIRNSGSKEELQMLGELEKNVAFAIKHGFRGLVFKIFVNFVRGSKTIKKFFLY